MGSSGKGSIRRPCLISREEEDFRWDVFMGKIKVTSEEFDKKIEELRNK